ncbi:MAG: PHP domain-containing protein [Dermatophilaceae bacterium]|nr:PHP domain-containing protein [Dermatophilaceae bacterium]
MTSTGAGARPVIDLHTHSSVSDGTETPADLVAAASAAGVDVLAITDHDTVAGWHDAADAARLHGVTLVRGIEISCAWRYSSIHLLGYLTDPADQPLAHELARARDSRSTRLERMVGLMAADGIPLTYAEVLAQVGPGATAGRPHIADALIANGTIRHRDEAFRQWLGDDSPYYVGHYAPDPVRAVELVRAAGGVPVIAHPFTRTRSGGLDDTLIERMRAAGLVGLEAYHRDHGAAEVERATALADRLGLVLTGSSDYHGEGKRNRLAENTTAPEVLDAIEAASSGVTEVLRP